MALHCTAGQAGVRSDKMASLRDANFEVVFQVELFFSLRKVLTKKILSEHRRRQHKLACVKIICYLLALNAATKLISPFVSTNCMDPLFSPHGLPGNLKKQNILSNRCIYKSYYSRLIHTKRRY